MKGDATPAQIFDNVKMMVDKVAEKVCESKKAELPIAILVSVEIKPDRIEDFKKTL